MESSTKKRIAIGASAVVALLLAAGWWIGLIGPTDPAVAEMQQIFDEALANGAPPPREVMEERMSQLTDRQRRQFFMRNREKMREMMTQRLAATLTLPRDQRDQEIAERADRLVALRANGGAPDRGGPPGGPRGPGGEPPAGQADRMKRILSFTTPEMRGAFTEIKRLIDDELESRGEPPIEPREMREIMRPRGA